MFCLFISEHNKALLQNLIKTLKFIRRNCYIEMKYNNHINIFLILQSIFHSTHQKKLFLSVLCVFRYSERFLSHNVWKKKNDKC